MGSASHSNRSLIAFTPALLWGGALVFVLALIFGGATRQGLWSDAIVQLVSLPLLAAALIPLTLSSARPILWPLVIVSGAVLLPLYQLIPLPPQLWTALPGRAAFAEMYAQAGMALPWLPVSLDPGATWRAALSLIPPVAVFLATAQLGFRARRTMTLVLGAAAVASILLGVAQFMLGPNSGLRLFVVTNTTDSVGFFANRNHYAALLYATLPFVAAWIAGMARDRRPERAMAIVAAMLVFVAIVIGLAIARSRAGILLACVVSLASLVIVMRDGGSGGRRAALAVGAATLIGAALAVHYAFFSVAARLGDGVVDENRIAISVITFLTGLTFQPTGAGFGTFEAIYQTVEPTSSMIPSYVNHAHNDWAELWLEGGGLALAVLAGFLVWYAASTIRIWRARPFADSGPLDAAIARAATVAIGALLLHSWFDYPLRTTAMSVVFAFCAALLVEPVRVMPGSYLPAQASEWWDRWQARRTRRKFAGWT